MSSKKHIIFLIPFFSLLAVSCEKYNLERTNPVDPKTSVHLPDLVVQNMNVNPSQVSKGNDVTISCIVKNQGNAAADFPLIQFDGLYYFLSNDTIYNTSDIELGHQILMIYLQVIHRTSREKF